MTTITSSPVLDRLMKSVASHRGDKRQQAAIERLIAAKAEILALSEPERRQLSLCAAICAAQTRVFKTPHGDVPLSELDASACREADQLSGLVKLYKGLPELVWFDYLASATGGPALPNELVHSLESAELSWRCHTRPLAMRRHLEIFSSLDDRDKRYGLTAYLPTIVRIAVPGDSCIDQVFVVGESHLWLGLNHQTEVKLHGDGKLVDLQSVSVSWRLPDYQMSVVGRASGGLLQKVHAIYSALTVASSHDLTVRL